MTGGPVPLSGPGLIIAAPASGSGKTTITLGLLRLLRRQGLRVGSAKVGPDYIDPAFHAAASGAPCRTLDSWAMRPETLAGIADAATRDCDLLVCEGVMGLFDGAGLTGSGPDGSTAEIAALTGWPVVLVIDCAGMSGSVAAIARGFADFRKEVGIAGLLLNRVASDRHRHLLARALADACPDLPVLGFLPRQASIALPARHLGLVQAGEHADLGSFLEGAADWIAAHVDIALLRRIASPSRLGPGTPAGIPPLGQRIAVARDNAFAFAYPALLESWRTAGADLSFFSPLADESPASDRDAIYLPGGYPELHAGRLAGNETFLSGLRAAAGRGAAIYGECGGYMVLGRVLEDGDGQPHAMAGLLPVDTSFARRERHLGYRQIRTLGPSPLGPEGQAFRGHEFHYATLTAQDGAPLFSVQDAAGADLGPAGQRAGSVCGAFIHLIDRARP